MYRRNFFNISLVAVMLIATLVPAAEFVVTDHTFTFTEKEHGFHYFKPDAGAPANWKSPDNYYNGKWEIRYELKSYPSSKSVRLQTCIWADVVGNWQSWKEMCSGEKTCGGPGVYYHSSSPSGWWKMNGTPVDWTRPQDYKDLGMVLRKGNGCIISDWGNWCWSERADYLPMEARLTIVAVSSGSTFSGWDKYESAVPARYETPRPSRKSGFDMSLRNTGRLITVETTLQETFIVRLFDVQGREISRVDGRAGEATIPVLALRSGIYIVRIQPASQRRAKTVTLICRKPML